MSKATSVSLLVALFCLLLGGGQAQTRNYSGPFETRFGTLERVVGQQDFPHDDGIALRGVPVVGVEGRYNVVRTLNWGERGDVLLLRHWSGGASCCTSFQIVRVDGSGATASEVFAQHGEAPKEFVISDDAIRFRLERGYPASIDHWIVSYDGIKTEIETVWEDDSGVTPAGAGADVTRWEGEWPYLVLEDASERNRFRRIMSDGTLDRFRISLKVAPSRGAKIVGGYLVGAGCWPRRCDARFAFFAIEIETGKVIAALLDDGDLSTFGADRSAFPAPLERLVADRLAKIREFQRRRAKWKGRRNR